MPIPIEVSYLTVGKKKTRNVIGVLCPTALTQVMGIRKAKPIYVEMGDVIVDWNKTSAGFEMMEILSTNAKLTGRDDENFGANKITMYNAKLSRAGSAPNEEVKRAVESCGSTLNDGLADVELDARRFRWLNDHPDDMPYFEHGVWKTPYLVSGDGGFGGGVGERYHSTLGDSVDAAMSANAQ